MATTTAPEINPAQCERVFARIALAASLTANALRSAAEDSTLIPCADLLYALALDVDVLAAMADSAIGFPTNGSFEQCLFGGDFHDLGRG